MSYATKNRNFSTDLTASETAWIDSVKTECIEGSANLASQLPKFEAYSKGFDEMLSAVWRSEDAEVFQKRRIIPKVNEAGKVIKYTTPSKGSVDECEGGNVFMPHVSKEIAQRIALRHGLDSVPHTNFWAWVKRNPSIEVWVTEGAKKCQSLLATGRVSVALAGVWNGVEIVERHVAVGSFDKGAAKSIKLIDRLSEVVVAGRPINLCFDQDSRTETIANVDTALARTAGCCIDLGAIVHRVTWSEDCKGIDDLIVEVGPNPEFKLTRHFSGSVQTLKTEATDKKTAWVKKQDDKVHALHTEWAKKPGEPTHTGKGNYISTEMATNFSNAVISLGQGKASIVTADMGSGKTYTYAKEQLAAFRKAEPEGIFVYVAPRTALVVGVAKMLGLQSYTDGVPPADATGYATTVESLKSLSGALNRRTKQGDGFVRVFLFVDEQSATTAQLLAGSTGTTSLKDQYQELSSWLDAVKERGYLVLSEDGVTKQDVDFFGLPIGPYFEFVRDAKSRNFSFVKKSNVLIDATVEALVDGKRVVAVSDSIEYGKALLAVAIGHGLTSEKTSLIVSSETDSKLKNNFMGNPIGYCKENGINFLIITPSCQTGVSINDEGANPWFGFQTVYLTHLGYRNARQMVMRLRSDAVETMISAPTSALIAKTSGNRLQLADPEFLADEDQQNFDQMIETAPFSTKYYAMVATEETDGLRLNKLIRDNRAAVYYSYLNLRDNLMSDLIAKGHTVLDGPKGGPDSPSVLAYKAQRGFNHKNPLIPNQVEDYGILRYEAAEKFAALSLEGFGSEEAKAVRGDTLASFDERELLRKYDLVARHPNLAAAGHFSNTDSILTIDSKFITRLNLRRLVLDEAARNDEHSIRHKALHNSVITEPTMGQGVPVEKNLIVLSKLNLTGLKADFIASLGFDCILDGTIEKWSKTSEIAELDAIKTRAIALSKDLYRLLRLTVNAEQPPAVIVNKVLKQLGYRLTTNRYRDADGGRSTWFSIERGDILDQPEIDYEPSDAEKLAKLREAIEGLALIDLALNHKVQFAKAMYTPQQLDDLDLMFGGEPGSFAGTIEDYRDLIPEQI